MSKKTTPQKAIQELQGVTEALRQKIIERGGSVTEEDGLRDLEAKLDALVKLRGEERQAQVSKAGSIFRGDSVTVAWEFEVGDTVRFALEDVQILAVDQAPLADVGAVLYTQDGDTKLKLFNGERMGNTVVVAEGEALEGATLTMEPAGGSLYILYNRDGDGQITAVRYSRETLETTVKWTDIWMDGGDPENIVAAHHLDYGIIVICCTRLPEGETEDDSRQAVVLSARVDANVSGGMHWLGAETPLTEESYPDLRGIAYSKDAYAQGWAVECYGDIIYITYPKPEEQGRGLLAARGVLGAGEDGGAVRMNYTPIGYVDCLMSGSIPSAALTVEKIAWQTDMGINGWTLLAHGVTRIHETTKNIESLLALELWVQGNDRPSPVLLWFGEEDVKYATNISRVCVGGMWGRRWFAGYSHGNTMYGIVVDPRPGGAVGGAKVALGEFEDFATILPMGENAVVVYQKDASGYIRTLTQKKVVVRAPTGRADAVAMEDGATGQSIRIQVMQQ